MLDRELFGDVSDQDEHLCAPRAVLSETTPKVQARASKKLDFANGAYLLDVEPTGAIERVHLSEHVRVESEVADAQRFTIVF